MDMYTQRMKTALEKCRETILKQQKLLKFAKDIYNPSAYREREQEIRAAMEKARETAASEIDAAAREQRANARLWGTVKPQDIPEDAKLLDGSFTLSQSEFDALAEKHAGNGTMCRLLSEYAAKRNDGKTMFSPGYMDTSSIPKVDDKIKAIDHVAASANGLLKMITEEGYMSGPNNPLTVRGLNDFGND